MAVHSRLETRPLFVPIVGSFLKGLAVTIPLHLAEARPRHDGRAAPRRARRALRRRALHPRDAAARPDGARENYFDVQACNDTNRADLFVFGNDTQVVLMCRLDNLGKGASGAAVQCMNVHLGIDEGTGL
jgi:N-acetyl-gamma-glutamyl-phosphate reductase